MKNANERSLNAARQETNRLLRNVHTACSSLQANLKAQETQNQVKRISSLLLLSCFVSACASLLPHLHIHYRDPLPLPLPRALQLSGDRERADRANLEHQMKERTQELEELKTRTEGAMTDLNRRYGFLTLLECDFLCRNASR